MVLEQQLVPVILLIFLTYINLSSQQCTSPVSTCNCDTTTNGKKQINCRNKGFTAIPTFTPTSEVYDEITFGSSQLTGCSRCNKISIVPDNAFANVRVKKIILTQNAVSTFSANAFSGLEDILESLEIEGDGTNFPPYTVITSLTKLQLLHFEHFQQSTMTKSNTLSFFPQLKELAFVNIKTLTSIDYDAFLYGADLQKFPSLTAFKLSEILTINTLPVAPILRLENLEKLEISDLNIAVLLGSSFEDLHKLKELHIIQNTKLDSISSTAFNGIYDTLEFLFLGHNQLQNLNFLTSVNWEKLTQLNLQYNPIQTIPGSTFNQMSQLAYLNLDSCHLENIESSIFVGLTKLHTLVLSNNKIKTVASGAFQNSPELTDLQLDKQKDNMVLNENSFQGIESSLNHLNINENTIDVSLFWALIEKLPNLLELRALETSLMIIPDKAFKNNTKLTYLDLGNNSISSVNESSFYRLRDSLETISLTENSISSISKCVFDGFTKMNELHLQQNPLQCDCRIQWLYDWVHSKTDIYHPSFLIGPCQNQGQLNGKYLNELSLSDLACDVGYVEPTCTDLYATTTTTTTTITSSTSTTTTERPLIIPTIDSIDFGPISQTSINMIWTVSDKTDVTGYVLDIREGAVPYRSDILLHRDKSFETVLGLEPDTWYTFCLSFTVNNTRHLEREICELAKTLPPVETTTAAVTPKPETNIGIIVGAVVGGVAFIAVVILIVVLLLRFKKPPKKMPPAAAVSFAPAPSGTLPQAGGTARRFAKPKDGKDGAADAEDIQITTISNGDLDGKDRFSAGSYQFLHEKDFHRPGPSTSKAHYVNDVSVERPLPRTPYGIPESKGDKSKGYVNTGFTGSANPLPETSANTYSELDASKIKK